MLPVLGGIKKRVYPSLIFAMRALAIGKQRNTRDCKKRFLISTESDLHLVYEDEMT
jgi:hypothetical protein